MSCLVCKADIGDDYSINRYSVLGYETQTPICRACLVSALPALQALEDGERAMEAEYQAKARARETSLMAMRDAPTRQEFKRLWRENNEKGYL